MTVIWQLTCLSNIVNSKNYIGQRSAVEMSEVLIWFISVLCVLGERGEQDCLEVSSIVLEKMELRSKLFIGL